MDFTEIGFVDVDYFYVAEIAVRVWAVVSMVLKLRVA
jgi:hypothetical protein